MKTPKEVALAWLDAWNKHDAAVLVELYAEDAENIQVAFGESLRGREALLENFNIFFKAFPDSYTNPENVFVDGEWAIIEWNGGGTFTGALGDIQPNGKSFNLRGCGFLHIIKGKIRFQRGYFDRYTWFSQLGLPMNEPEIRA